MNCNRIILITGCSSGIGLETAIECAKAGHRVIAGVRNQKNKSILENEIEKNNLRGNLEIIELDMSKFDTFPKKIDDIIKKYSRIDVLFNNAGFMTLGSLEDCSIDEINNQLYTDLLGPILLTKHAIPHMKNGKNPGLVINMSSVAGRLGFGLSTTYCTSKFGIEGFSESLRMELIEKNINVAVIEAGVVNTNFFKNIIKTEKSKSSQYAKDTERFWEIIIKFTNNSNAWINPNIIAREITYTIIPDNGKKFRYVYGNDANYLISNYYQNADDISKVDKIILDIIEDYSK